MPPRRRRGADPRAIQPAGLPAGGNVTGRGPQRPYVSEGSSETRNKKSRGIDWFAVGAWAFEIFTAVLSVVDVLSDVAVASQFYSDGHMGWFWMVAWSLVVSSCIYSALAVDMIIDKRFKWLSANHQYVGGNGRRHRNPNERLQLFVAYFLVLLPVAQLFPLVQWRFEKYDEVHANGPDRPRSKRDPVVKLAGDGDGMTREDSWHGRADTAAAREDLDADEEVRRLVHRMHKSFERHMMANVGFYVETVVEAIPQAVIQLIAVTALGEATPLQLLSMCLSLFSIVSKAYGLAFSYDVRAMLFKASLVAFDVFSLFFLFATVLARDEAVEETVHMLAPSALGMGNTTEAGPGLVWVGLLVSSLAAGWLRKHFYILGVACITFVGGCGWVAYMEYRHRRRIEAWQVALLAVCFLVAFVPAALAIELVKVSLLLWPLMRLQPPQDSMPFYAIAFGFYRRGLARGRAEGFSRLKHVLRYCVDFTATHSSSRDDAQRNWWRRRNNSDEFARRMHAVIDEGHVQLWSLQFSRRQSLLPSHAAPVPTPLTTQVRGLLRTLRNEWRASSTPDCIRGVAITLSGIWLFHCIIVYVYSLFFNLAFPFVHAWRYGLRHQNMLQLTCLACSGASLAVLVALLPFMFRFVSFTYIVKKVCMSAGFGVGVPKTAQDALSLVNEYHKPPHVAALKSAVDVAVLPPDVTEMTASFLQGSDLDFSRLSVDECAALKDRAQRV